MSDTIKNRLPGLLLTVALTITEILFLCLLGSTKLVPGKFLLIGGAVLLVVTVLLWLLLWNWKKKGRWITGAVFVLILVLVMGGASFYVCRTVSMLNNITNTSVEVSDVAIYVKADDDAKALADIKGYSFGILAEKDRENTDKVLEMLEKTYGVAVTAVTYDGIGQMVEDLLVGSKIQAMILNTTYFELFSEMDGMDVVCANLRQLHLEKVETQVEIIPDATKDTEPEQTLAEDTLPTFCLYLSGVDTYGDIMAKGRSDVNIIAAVNPNTRQVLLLSTPRDYYVELPIYGGVMDKLTHAGIYGIDVSMETLEDLYGEKIDYYFRVNFSGFEDIIDALDGVTVDSEYSFTAIDGHYYSEGENLLYGEAALSFARERQAFSSGDIQRGKNQMAVIKAVIQKALSPVLLTNFTSIMESLEGSFETNIPYDLLAQIVREQLENGGSWNIVTHNVTGEGNTLDCFSASEALYVMMQDEDQVEEAAKMIDQVMSGKILKQGD